MARRSVYVAAEQISCRQARSDTRVTRLAGHASRELLLARADGRKTRGLSCRDPAFAVTEWTGWWGGWRGKDVHHVGDAAFGDRLALTIDQRGVAEAPVGNATLCPMEQLLPVRPSRLLVEPP